MYLCMYVKWIDVCMFNVCTCLPHLCNGPPPVLPLPMSIHFRPFSSLLNLIVKGWKNENYVCVLDVCMCVWWMYVYVQVACTYVCWMYICICPGCMYVCRMNKIHEKKTLSWFSVLVRCNSVFYVSFNFLMVLEFFSP